MKKEKCYIVHFSLESIFKIGPVRFLPGTNILTESQWEAIKDHPLLPYRFEQGHLVWQEGKSPENYLAPQKRSTEDSVEDESPLEDDVLSSYSAADAKELVKKTFSLELLEFWKEKEDRKTVLAAIEDQIEELLKIEEKKE